VSGRHSPARRCGTPAARRPSSVLPHGYHDVHGCLPWNKATNTCINSSCGWSFLTKVLPYVEQEGLYNQLDWGLDVWDPHNVALLGPARIKTLICPSDPGDPVNPNGHSWRVNPTSGLLSSYVGSVGDGTLLDEDLGYSREGSNARYGCGGCNGNADNYGSGPPTAEGLRATVKKGSNRIDFTLSD
jgi:hypothetical protein